MCSTLWWRNSTRSKCRYWWRCQDWACNNAVRNIPSFDRFSALRRAIESSTKTACNDTLNMKERGLNDCGHKICRIENFSVTKKNFHAFLMFYQHMARYVVVVCIAFSALRNIEIKCQNFFVVIHRQKCSENPQWMRFRRRFYDMSNRKKSGVTMKILFEREYSSLKQKKKQVSFNNIDEISRGAWWDWNINFVVFNHEWVIKNHKIWMRSEL